MRKWNFSAGPATIPLSVLKETQSELLEFKSTGMSVMEMSHRSKDYGEIANACLLYTSPSPRDMRRCRMPSSA